MFKPIVADMVPKLSFGGFPEYCLDRIIIIILIQLGTRLSRKSKILKCKIILCSHNQSAQGDICFFVKMYYVHPIKFYIQR
jgi:hypothetical protein